MHQVRLRRSGEREGGERRGRAAGGAKAARGTRGRGGRTRRSRGEERQERFKSQKCLRCPASDCGLNSLDLISQLVSIKRFFVGSGESDYGGKRRVRRDTGGVRGERRPGRRRGGSRAAPGGRQGEGLHGPRSRRGRKKGGVGGRGRKRSGRDNGVSNGYGALPGAEVGTGVFGMLVAYNQFTSPKR